MKTAEELIELALNAACKAVQDELDTTGDAAGMFFDADSYSKKRFKEAMISYVRFEISTAITQRGDRS